MIIECEEVNSLNEVRQGDILEWVNRENYWHEYAVIITADCDIAQNKNDDIFSYCPIISLEKYIKEYYLRKKIKISTVIKETKSALDKHFISKGDADVDIDINLFLDMLKDDGYEQTARYFDIKNQKVIKKLKFIEDFNYKKVDNYELYFDYKSLSGNIEKNKVISKLEKDIQSFIKQPPGDIFYLNYIANTSNIGFVINLRRIGMLSKDQITTNYEVKKGQFLAKRIGHLCSPFSYRLTQKVGQMFSDIGLPEEYEKDCSQAVNILGGKIRSDYE